MKKLILVPMMCIAIIASAQFDYKTYLKKTFKFSTFYVAANGGTSLSDVDVYSVTNGEQVMNELNKMYVDTPSTEYNSISAFAGKVMLHFTKKYFSFVEAYEMGNTKVRPENMRYEVILHMGDVDPSNPVKDFFHKYTGFWTDYQNLEYFASNVFVHKTNLKNNFRIIGAFQQSKEVEALDPENFPFGKVIDFHTIMEYYNNYYVKGKKKTS